VYALVEQGAVGELDGIELVDDPGTAQVVLLGGPDESWTYGRLNAVFRALLGGVPLVAMQQNRWWPTADGPALDAGMFVVGLSYAAATEPVVVGKPSTEIYRSACRLLGVDPAEAMMVGDDPESDLAPAAGIGMRTAWCAPAGGAASGAAEVDLDLPDLAAARGSSGSGQPGP
jgi:ribonucleotide monophosphatase NagD (HAD superfamily)